MLCADTDVSEPRQIVEATQESTTLRVADGWASTCKVSKSGVLSSGILRQQRFTGTAVACGCATAPLNLVHQKSVDKLRRVNNCKSPSSAQAAPRNKPGRQPTPCNNKRKAPKREHRLLSIYTHCATSSRNAPCCNSARTTLLAIAVDHIDGWRPGTQSDGRRLGDAIPMPQPAWPGSGQAMQRPWLQRLAEVESKFSAVQVGCRGRSAGLGAGNRI